MPVRKLVTLDKTLAISPNGTDQLDLPRDHVIDDIVLRFQFSYSATSAPSLWDVLKAIQEVRVVSDGSIVHWSLRGDDIYILNYYDQQGAVPVYRDQPQVPAEIAETGATITLRLATSEILANLKSDLKLSVRFGGAIGSITSFSGAVTVSVEQLVYDPNEFVEAYGPNLENLAEPKVTAEEATLNAGTQFQTVSELPVGNLLKRTVMVVTDSSGNFSDSVVDRIRLMNKPGAQELLNEAFTILGDKDSMEYQLTQRLTGVVFIDYGIDVTEDNLGLRMWRVAKGDITLETRNNANGRARLIHEEIIVNTEYLDEAGV
ncbi:MAG: phage capsid protein [Pyrobaculum arsenaticum]|uniref:phage capsid protein n=1 Tax=Pyrobaculum arsenaticum TaxID=121277 RepID=UPI002275678A|nr:phage capsid protein [Pyrobaculum arsenaticum]